MEGITGFVGIIYKFRYRPRMATNKFRISLETRHMRVIWETVQNASIGNCVPSTTSKPKSEAGTSIATIR